MDPLLLILFLLAQSRLHQAHPPGGTMAEDPNRFALEAFALNRSSISQVHPTPFPGQMTMLSIFSPSDEEEKQLRVPCKLDRPMNNVDANIAILGVVQEDVVSAAGKILIPAGSKVFGQGYCDPEQGRVLGRGRWIFYLSDHLVMIQGALRDKNRMEGLKGEEIASGMDETRIKRAIYRDGIYLYVPSEREFTLDLKGSISVQDLPTAYGK